MHHSNRAFTKTELLVILGILAVLILVAIVGFQVAGRMRTTPVSASGTAHQLRDSSHMRGIMQALLLHAQNNADTYPLPSLLDTADMTVPESGTAKDTSANIYSLMLWNGLATTELLVSPAEKGNVAKFTGYELSQPRAAVSPGRAMWDPAFRADFTGTRPGGVSYAHMLPGGQHTPAWGASFNANAIAISNRGPNVSGVSYDAAGAVASANVNPQSITNNIYAPTNTWSGNVGHNDNHVSFQTTLTPTAYSHTPGAGRGDVLFYDEPDDVVGTNNFLSLFITAGDANEDFTSIWD